MNTREVMNDLENLKVFESLVETMRTIGSGLYPKLEKKLRPINGINSSSQLAMNLAYSYFSEGELGNIKNEKIKKMFGEEGKGKVCIVTIGSNRAFCGDLNRKIVKRTNEIIAKIKNTNEEYFLVSLGKKLLNSFPQINQNCQKNYEFPEKILKNEDSSGLISVIENISVIDFKRVILIFTKLEKTVGNSNIKTVQTDIQLIPFKPEKEFKSDATLEEFEFKRKLLLEPDLERVMLHTIQQYLFTNFLFALLNSYTCENLLRMNSMNQASKSIKDDIIKKNRMIAKERKRVITKNLIEVISASIQEKELEKQIR